MSIRVSVVIPTYKSAAWVEETLRSVVRQTYPAELLEIVVVDDASPDDSAQVAARFLEKQSIKSRVVRHEKNSGAPANRNSGWRLAEGDWIQFLDADDLLAPHKIELQAKRAAECDEKVAVVYTNWQYLVEEGGRWQPTGPINAPFVDYDPLVQILQQPTFGYVGPTLIRRAMLAQVGGFSERPNIGEDTDLMFRMAMAGGQFRQARSDVAAFLYRQWPNSLWRNYVKNVVAMRNLLLTVRSAEEHLRARRKDGSLPEDARLALAKRYSKWAEFYAEHDPETFRLLKGWLKDLGLAQPQDLNRTLAVLSSLVGYENAVRIRARYRKQFRRET